MSSSQTPHPHIIIVSKRKKREEQYVLSKRGEDLEVAKLCSCYYSSQQIAMISSRPHFWQASNALDHLLARSWCVNTPAKICQSTQ